MSTKTTNHAAKLLGYRLDEHELGTYATLDLISGQVADVVVVLAQRDLAVACAYLAERVPGAVGVEAKVADLAGQQADRFLSFSDLERIRRSLGRDLEPAELETFTSLEQVTDTVEAMVERIRKGCGRVLAVTYLYERVPRCYHGDVKIRTEEIENKYERLRKR